MNYTQFKGTVYKYFRQNSRQFPWRETFDPYHILVSEFMLQQTQTDRVIPKFEEWIKKFPNVETLAQASLGQVLVAWQGLGYNRRAKFLHQSAQKIIRDYQGIIPNTEVELIALPGIGKYTAAAILAFAFNLPVIVIETNIRAVFIHHFFANQDKVDDKELIPLIEQSIDQDQPRLWYSALMDYGAHLKKQTANPSRRSSHYVKQSAFKGSDRQIRGQIIKLLTQYHLTTKHLYQYFANEQPSRILTIADKLQKEGLISKTGSVYHLINNALQIKEFKAKLRE